MRLTLEEEKEHAKSLNKSSVIKKVREMTSSIEAIQVTQAVQVKTIDSGASKQTYLDSSNLLDESSGSLEPAKNMKKQSSSKTSVGKKLDDSFQEVTNRRQAKQVSKQKA